MKFNTKYQFLGFGMLLLIACSAPKIHIPGSYETKAVFVGEEAMDITPYAISEAGDLADEFPDEEIINDRIKVTIDFKFNEKYDSSEYYKGYIAENKRIDSLKRLNDSTVRATEKSIAAKSGGKSEIKKTNKSFSKNPELTDRPIPDGQVYMSSNYEYSYKTIKDFIDEPIVIHYNSMISIRNFYATIDNNTVALKKRDESNDGYMYFKTDSRYKIYDLSVPVRGSNVAYEYTEECRDAKFNSVLYIAEDHFTQKKTVKIALPDFLEFDIIEKNFEGVNFTKDTVMEYPKSGGSGQKTKYIVYTFKRLKAIQNLSSDRGPSYNYPMLYFHFKKASKDGKSHHMLENTDDLYQWYKLVSSNLRNDTSAFAQFTKKLVKDKKTDEEKIKAVYYWIQDNIRYIAFEDGLAGFRPDECSDVYMKRFGDCKGMANLTKNMLKVLGYDSRLVWIGTKHQNFSYAIPGLPVDNHAICAVKLNGKFLFLDGTENYCALNEYANRIQGRQCIVEDGNKYSIETIPQWGYEHNEQSSVETIDIINNALDVKVKKTFKGESKLEFIRSYNYLRTQNKEMVIYEYLTDENIDYQVKNIVTSDLGNRDINTVLNYNLTVDNQVVTANGKQYINFEWEREYDGAWFDSTRRVDFDFGHKIFINRSVTVNLKPGQLASRIPGKVMVDNDYYKFSLEMKQVGNTIVYNKVIITKKDYLPASMLQQFMKDCKQLSVFYNTYIELTPAKI
jgi:hypothetical protein